MRSGAKVKFGEKLLTKIVLFYDKFCSIKSTVKLL